MGKDPVTQTIVLARPACRKNGVVMVPARLFEEGMFTYLTIENGVVAIERAGCVVNLPVDGVHAYDDNGVVMVDAAAVISRLNVDFEFVGDVCNVIVEAKTMGSWLQPQCLAKCQA